MLFLDTNIFLESMLNQKQAKAGNTLLKQLEKPPTRAWIVNFQVYSIILILQQKTKKLETVKTFLSALASYEGIQIFEPKIKTMFTACNFQTRFKLDFDDALVLASMDALGMQIIVSFDKHFRRLPQIKV